MRMDWGREVVLVDPTAGETLRLDMQRRTFQRISERLDATDAALSEAPTDARAVQNVEPLGSKIIEGLPSDGRRIVQDVDFGAEHSELGVTVTTEIWVASELGVPVLVLMTSSNGRQTRYALRNVRFEETSPAQFVVPEGFEEAEARQASGLRPAAL